MEKRKNERKKKASPKKWTAALGQGRWTTTDGQTGRMHLALKNSEMDNGQEEWTGEMDSTIWTEGMDIHDTFI